MYSFKTISIPQYLSVLSSWFILILYGFDSCLF